MAANKGDLTEDKRVAILLLSIEQDLAAKILRRLGDDMIDNVTRAMKGLQDMAIDHETVASTLKQGVRRLRRGDMALGDVSGIAETVLVKAFGKDRGLNMNKQADTDILSRRPFSMFDTLSGPDLAVLLIEEHPQIAAVFVAHLDRSKAGSVLAAMPVDRQADLIYRVSTLDRTPPDVVQRVLDVMRAKVKNLGLTTLRAEPKAWIQAAAQILNNMGGGEKDILERVGETSVETADAIRDEMFTFDDIGKLDKRAMQKILSQVDTRVLAVSLKAAPDNVEEAIFSNLSKRAGEMVAEERDTLGPMPISEVFEAQHEILNVIRGMMDKGEIKASGLGETMV